MVLHFNSTLARFQLFFYGVGFVFFAYFNSTLARFQLNVKWSDRDIPSDFNSTLARFQQKSSTKTSTPY